MADLGSREASRRLEAFRWLAAAVQQSGCTSAEADDVMEQQWLHSKQARTWAELLDLPNWPPRLEQLSSRTKRARHRREPADVRARARSGDVAGPVIRSIKSWRAQLDWMSAADTCRASKVYRTSAGCWRPAPLLESREH